MLRDTLSTESNSINTEAASPELKHNSDHELIHPSDTHNLAERLLKQGYRDFYLNLARSDAGIQLRQSEQKIVVEPHSPIIPTARRQAPGRKARGKKISLREEMPRAVRAYDLAVTCVREAMVSAAQGNFVATGATDAVQGLVDSLERNMDALICLPRVGQRGPYTFTHSVNVSVLLAAYAMTSGMKRDTIITYGLAGFFHDIGKALLPSALLCARRTLSVTEQTLVMRHPTLGCDLLATLPDLDPEVLMAVLEHHERYDGSGYPKGISGNTISNMGQLAAIADAYDALSSTRPYRGPLVPHKTLGVLYQMRQKQFHPEKVEKFVRMVGIYPVGSVVRFKDGYRGVVTASNRRNPMLPVITLMLDPQGGSMCPHECDLAKEAVSGIDCCLQAESSGIDLRAALGIDS